VPLGEPEAPQRVNEQMMSRTIALPTGRHVPSRTAIQVTEANGAEDAKGDNTPTLVRPLAV